MTFVGSARVFSILLHTIYGNLWLPPAGHEVAAICDPYARCRISVFEILPLGGVKLLSLAIIWEEICIFFSHLRQTIGGECSFPFALYIVGCVMEFHFSEVPKALSN